MWDNTIQKLNIGDREFTIRTLKNISDFQQAQFVQRHSWGLNSIDVLPIHLMVAMKDSSIQLGIFDESRLVCLALLYPAKQSGRYLMHMLCTIPEYRNIGLGKNLLFFIWGSRDIISDFSLYWTFDPFDYVNSHLYLNVLGAFGYKAELNFYGEIDSDAHGQLPSHRLFCELKVSNQPMQKLNTTCFVTLPTNLPELKKKDVKESIQIMDTAYYEIRSHFKENYRITGFDWPGNGQPARLIFTK